ncbi:MAG: hypothetical protein A2293_05785 [Elusimicrobia bacterium RIFOXYB2_FULL_49_7]|nr:MAG: hypothetical protein A2293_05785 [Elusimicrobia bacterium RIFOXYB2_FULL_49_7]
MVKQYKSVTEFTKNILGDTEAKEIADAINKKRISKQLFAMRCKAGLTQAELARKASISQGKVSKLEMAEDKNISIGDLVTFCSAIGMQLEIGFTDQRLTRTDKIKLLYFKLRNMLEELRMMAKGDPEMEEGVAKFTAEAFFNIIIGLFDCLEKAKVKKEKAPEPMLVSEPIDKDNIENLGKTQQAELCK